ncbi:MAG TPA: DUF2269 family protein [Thermoanaerobaculia bacterium]|nr:DUF2269 family protein [Thermoanaerobaculia bacterium]
MYHLLKLIHVFAVILFLGNIITGLFWKRHADATRDRAIIAHTLRGLIRADRWFTVPGVIVITAAGILAAVHIGLPLLRTGWILWSIVLFSLSGAAFGWKVGPLQKQLLRMMEGPDIDWPLYRAKSLEWELWGLFATVTPAGAVVLMTMKPVIYSFPMRRLRRVAAAWPISAAGRAG